MRLERLISTRRVRGPLFCPRCCWKLGRAESPAIGYLTQCGGCKRPIRIVELDGTGELAVIVRDAQPEDRGVFVELEAFTRR